MDTPSTLVSWALANNAAASIGLIVVFIGALKTFLAQRAPVMMAETERAKAKAADEIQIATLIKERLDKVEAEQSAIRAELAAERADKERLRRESELLRRELDNERISSDLMFAMLGETADPKLAAQVIAIGASRDHQRQAIAAERGLLIAAGVAP